MSNKPAFELFRLLMIAERAIDCATQCNENAIRLAIWREWRAYGYMKAQLDQRHWRN